MLRQILSFRMSSRLLQLCIVHCALCIGLVSCSKDKPDNPYDSVDYSTNTTEQPSPDANSIVGLHKNIFFPKCARSGCHDGTFEPDYRTVQSTYSTLVYQPTIKKFVLGSTDTFDLRVIPFDTARSFLHERIVTKSTDYMPSNGTRLSRDEIVHINNWIMSGAKDQYGNIPAAPDAQPLFSYFIVLDGTTQVDTIRVNGQISPILFKPGQNLSFYFTMTDDHTTVDQMTNVKMKFSTKADDFSSATSINATYVSFAKAWTVGITTSSFAMNTQYYFRFYFNDRKHTADAEFPRNDNLYIYKEYSSFIVK